MIAATGWRNNRWANRYPAGVTCKRERSQVRARNASGGGRAARQPDRIHVGWCAIGAGCDLLHHTVCHRRLRAESNGCRSAGGRLGGERAVLLLPLLLLLLPTHMQYTIQDIVSPVWLYIYFYCKIIIHTTGHENSVMYFYFPPHRN